jgi:A/G-specific adenine glycosylase
MEQKQLHNLHYLERQLLLYFKKSARRLPWRKKNISPYEVWVSEIMLQQTQVSRVVEYYTKFLRKFPNVYILARASWKQFLPYYAGLGYYARGRNMLKTAKIVVEKYAGKFPNTSAALQELPGIGPYTAAAILSFGLNQNALAFDTNMKKVFGRYLFGTKHAKILSTDLESMLVSNKRKLNAALMDFANDICLLKPKCDLCPLATRCKYHQQRGRGEVNSRVKHTFSTRNAMVLLWLHKNHKEYYSENLDAFVPFKIPPKNNTREKIKNHFQKKYGLTISVRPPHDRLLLRNTPTLLINAQILLGKHEFAQYGKEEAKQYLRKFEGKI